MITKTNWSIEVPDGVLEPADLLRLLPRLLRFRLVGREDRLLLRLARRLGFPAGASLQFSPGDPAWTMRAYLGSSPARWRRHLQLERAGLLGLATHPVARRLDGMVEPAASRLTLALRLRELTVLPLGCFDEGWRLLLLADGPQLSNEVLAGLRDVARAVIDAARFQEESEGARASTEFLESSGLGNGRDRVRATGEAADARIRVARGLIDRQQEIVANLSHDLKNPLASISTSLQVLDSGRAGELNQSQQRLLGLARRNCDRLLKMVNELVEGSRRHEMETVLQREELDVGLLLHSTMIDSREIAGEGHCHFAWVFDHGSRVYGDPRQLERIVDNLVSNALKFCGPGGHVLVSARKGQLRVEDEIGRAARALGLMPWGLTILVEDDGPGFSEEERRRAFERFWQSDREREKERGTGLGLSIVHALVHAHQGSVDLDSEPGRGTRVGIWLPEGAEDARLCGALQILMRQLQSDTARGKSVRLIMVEAVSAEEEILAGLSRLCATLGEDSQKKWTVHRVHPMTAVILLREGEMPESLARLMNSNEEGGLSPAERSDGRGETAALRLTEARSPEHGMTLDELLIHARRSGSGHWTAAAAQGAPTWEVRK